MNFRHDLFRIPDVFENRIALHTLENAGRKRHLLRIRGDVDALYGEQVEIDIALHDAACPADVQIPSAKRKILRYG